MWGLEDLVDAISSGEALYDDMISPDLIGVFIAIKETISKWTDEMIENDLYFTAQVLDPHIKFTLI
jgi:hypothetical protein